MIPPMFLFYLKRIVALILALCLIGVLLYISFIILLVVAFSSFALWIYLKVTQQSFDDILRKILNRKHKTRNPRPQEESTVIDGEYTVVKEERNQ